MAANVRSPRRLVVGVVSGPAFSGETVAVTWAPVVLEGEDRVRRPSPEGDRRTRLDQLAAICETIDVAFWDSAEVNGAEPAVFAAACWPAGETT